MKVFIYIFIILNSLKISAQIERTQVYYYPISNDEKKLFNYKLHQYKNDIYTAPYAGRLNKLENFGEMPFKDKGRYFHPHLIFVSDTLITTFSYGVNLTICKKDTTYKIKIPENINTRLPTTINDSILFISKNNDAIYHFKNEKFHKIKTLDSKYTYGFKNSYVYKKNKNTIWFGKYSTKIKFNKKFEINDNFRVLKFDGNNFIYINNTNEIIQYPHKKITRLKNLHSNYLYENWTIESKNSHYQLTDFVNAKQYQIPINENVTNYLVLNDYQTAYFGTSNMIAKSFLYLNKVPNVFANGSSKSCFALSEDENGTIYAGSYDRNFSIIKSDTIIQLKNPERLKFMNGSLNYKNKMYFISEGNPDGVWRLKNTSFELVKGTNAIPTGYLTGFFLFKSTKNKIYYGTNQKKILEINGKDLLKNKGNWNEIKVSSNTLSISEDNFGRIYYCDNYGLGIYNPENQKKIYFDRRENETDIKAMCSVKDSYGTMWFGGSSGIHYINPTKKKPLKTDIKKLNHPLLNDNTTATSFTIYENHLIIAKQNKILVLDLKKFNEYKTINLKYLSEHETNFKGSTEQNTMFTTKDNSIWFSTTNMIYHWDIASWFAIPKEKITPSFYIEKEKLNANTKLKPSENSFKLSFDYFTQDRLPRYLQYAFQYENDSMEWSGITTKHSIQQQNLKAGNYTFHLRVFEFDGTTSLHRKKITIPLFWFEKWYVWVCFGTLLFGITIFGVYNNYRRRINRIRVEKEKIRRKKEQEKFNKQLAQLQLTSVSNQFRPHFLLNTFNAIGARLDSGSYEELLLDTLGNSIDILFSMTKKEQNYHTLENEWELVKNIIKIYGFIYIKDLETILPPKELSEKYKDFEIPFGILQIPVENSLLHGLHNKPNPPYNLEITINDANTNLEFRIKDNGIGIEKSKSLSNVRKNGTGLKNLNRVIKILNKHNSEKIIFKFNSEVKNGTEVVITTPKNYHYEIN